MEKSRKKTAGNLITRRDFHKIAGTFGLTSALSGWSGLKNLGLAPSSEALAAEVSANKKKRYKKKAKFNLKFGGASYTEEGLKVLPTGPLNFIADLEERTDGEIRVEFIGGNQLCTELTCAKMCQEGKADFFSASTQNAASAMPYFNVLDFAYLWPSRASQYYFFYHPESESLFREPLRKFHKIQFLFTHCELRCLLMGQNYKDKPKIMTLDALKGAKLRVTASQLGRIALKLLGTNPVPVPWSETLNGLRIGLIDGAEAWSSVPYGKMGEVVSQVVHCCFISGNGQTSMNLDLFEKLGAELQNAVMESAYLAQISVQKTSEAKLVSVTGITDPPLPGSYYDKYGVKNCYWSKSELEKAEQIASPKYNPGPWEEWRERLNHMAGGIDMFEELYKIAREMPRALRLMLPPSLVERVTGKFSRSEKFGLWGDERRRQ